MSERLSPTLEEVNEYPETRKYKLEASFEGGTKQEQILVKEYIEDLGMPTNNIDTIILREAKRREEDLQGAYQPNIRALTLIKNTNVPLEVKAATFPHEIGHSLSPLDPKNEFLYGSYDAIDTSRQHTIAVTTQSELTGIYLNGYHAWLHEQRREDNIDDRRLQEEVHGILVELRFSNPNHLVQVEQAQKQKILQRNERTGEKIQPVNFVTSELDAKRGVVTGVDRTISSLIPDLKTKADIDNHVNALKAKYSGKQILPNHRLPKVA